VTVRVYGCVRFRVGYEEQMSGVVICGRGTCPWGANVLHSRRPIDDGRSALAGDNVRRRRSGGQSLRVAACGAVYHDNVSELPTDIVPSVSSLSGAPRGRCARSLRSIKETISSGGSGGGRRARCSANGWLSYRRTSATCKLFFLYICYQLKV